MQKLTTHDLIALLIIWGSIAGIAFSDFGLVLFAAVIAGYWLSKWIITKTSE